MEKDIVIEDIDAYIQRRLIFTYLWNEAILTHEIMWGVPCGPTLSMVKFDPQTILTSTPAWSLPTPSFDFVELGGSKYFNFEPITDWIEGPEELWKRDRYYYNQVLTDDRIEKRFNNDIKRGKDKL